MGEPRCTSVQTPDTGCRVCCVWSQNAFESTHEIAFFELNDKKTILVSQQKTNVIHAVDISKSFELVNNQSGSDGFGQRIQVPGGVSVTRYLLPTRDGGVHAVSLRPVFVAVGVTVLVAVLLLVLLLLPLPLLLLLLL